MELLPSISPERRYDIALGIDSEELAEQAQMFIRSVITQIMDEDIFHLKKDIDYRERFVTSKEDYEDKYSPIMVFVPGNNLAPKYNHVYLAIKILYTLDEKWCIPDCGLSYHAKVILSWTTERSLLAVHHQIALAKFDFIIKKKSGYANNGIDIFEQIKFNHKYDFLYTKSKKDHNNSTQQMSSEDNDKNKETSPIKDDDKWFAFKPRKIVSEIISMQIRKETFDTSHLSERFLHKALETMDYLLANKFLDLAKMDSNQGDSIRFQSCKNDFYLGVKSVFINIDIRHNDSGHPKNMHPFIIEFSWTESLSEFTQKHEIVNVYGGLNSSDHFYIGALKKD